jgi:hypothetical protein
MSVFDDKERNYGKLRFSGKKEDWPKWSAQFLALASVKKFKKSLSGQDTPPKENIELDEDSSDLESKNN